MRAGSLVRVLIYLGGGATSASCQEEWSGEKPTRKRAIFLLLLFHPLIWVKIQSNRNKAKCSQNDRKLHRESFAADSKI